MTRRGGALIGILVLLFGAAAAPVAPLAAPVAATLAAPGVSPLAGPGPGVGKWGPIAAQGAQVGDPAAGLAAGLASHRALYTMTLGSASRSSGVVGTQGAMAYRFSRGCEGWTSETQTTLRIQRGTGGEVHTVWAFANWESKDGLRYRYRLRNTRNGRVVEQIQGHASLNSLGGAGTATYSRPEAKTVALPKGTLFPTQHMLALIRAGVDRRAHLSKVVFDGSSLDNPFEISALMSRVSAEDARALAEERKLPDLPAWRVRMAFFPVATRASVPDFEIGVRYRSDGIADRIEQDFGDFTLDLVLSELEILPAEDC